MSPRRKMKAGMVGDIDEPFNIGVCETLHLWPSGWRPGAGLSMVGVVRVWSPQDKYRVAPPRVLGDKYEVYCISGLIWLMQHSFPLFHFGGKGMRELLEEPTKTRGAFPTPNGQSNDYENAEAKSEEHDRQESNTGGIGLIRWSGWLWSASSQNQSSLQLSSRQARDTYTPLRRVAATC